MAMPSSRAWFAIIAVCCVGLLGFAFYQQYRAFMDPCPLCIFQRVAFLLMGLVALLAALHNPRRTGQRVYASVIVVSAMLGALVAGRHLWLQSLPPDQVPECGPGLNYLLENFPLTDVLSTVLLGSGSCAEVHWRLLGLSMPGWTLFWYLVLGSLALWLAARRA
ncbi:MAG: disulfide bond formation protein B [Xanthomonadales bacterium]|nr:disulfide bond formation protein B [Xanthomonadales bacterium]NIN59337.1 disulfide bond formation protein B [Xanthomonadales bacterium]NIN74688.1 disulfide bond formation protein B [Xanthomonadales bacterium]NIO12588.1 disulfide bond formation protein B [Xanthomonadales bacterium]NIP11730.1 disulfide bond formation protein B [Xanthomonadales bacterium]